MLPTFFISHGAPTLPLEEGSPVHDFLRGLLDGLAPKAILIVSAHWEDEVAAVTGAKHLATIHDFYGFPERLYELHYEPAGDPALAQRVSSLIANAGIDSRVDAQRGIDHGGWTPLYIAAPEAEIPVVQLSMVRGLDPSTHLAIGRALQPLRRESVLVIGSGGAVHNLRALDWSMLGKPASSQSSAPWAAEFMAWMDETLTQNVGARRSDLLRDWQSAPNARMAHPRKEHLLPLHVAAAAAEDAAARKIHESWQMGPLSLAAYRFG